MRNLSLSMNETENAFIMVTQKYKSERNLIKICLLFKMYFKYGKYYNYTYIYRI